MTNNEKSLTLIIFEFEQNNKSRFWRNEIINLKVQYLQNIKCLIITQIDSKYFKIISYLYDDNNIHNI